LGLGFGFTVLGHVTKPLR